MLPLASRRQAARHQLTITVAEEDERERVMAGPLRGRRGWVAVAAVSLESYDATISQVTRGLVIGGAVITLAAGLGAYRLARAALSPVERMRRQVAALSERDEAPGVAVPRTRDEIAALAETMNEPPARLNRALGRQRALVADASHELRTPLAVLSGELELAARPGRSQAELQDAVAQGRGGRPGWPGSPPSCCSWPAPTRTRRRRSGSAPASPPAVPQRGADRPERPRRRDLRCSGPCRASRTDRPGSGAGGGGQPGGQRPAVRTSRDALSRSARP